jgi:hypothetical protein
MFSIGLIEVLFFMYLLRKKALAQFKLGNRYSEVLCYNLDIAGVLPVKFTEFKQLRI